jgi:hypothetical protein
MSAPDPAVLERRREVARRYSRGEAQWEIARALRVNAATVTRDLDAVRKEWRAEALGDLGKVVAEQLARIDECERQAWAGWAKSQENAETLRARKRGDVAETEKVSKGQAGDPRFLDVVLRCIERRCKLLGVEPPAQRNQSLHLHLAGLSDDEIEKRIAELQGRATRAPEGEGAAPDGPAPAPGPARLPVGLRELPRGPGRDQPEEERGGPGDRPAPAGEGPGPPGGLPGLLSGLL